MVLLNLQNNTKIIDFAYQSLVQRISVAVQRGNAAAVLGCSGMRGGV